MTHLSFLPAMRTTALLLLCCLCSCATIINGRSSTASTRFSTADVLVDSRGDTLRVEQEYTNSTGKVTYDHTRTRIVARKKADSTWEYWYTEIGNQPLWYAGDIFGAPILASLTSVALGKNSDLNGVLAAYSTISVLFGSAIDASLGSANVLNGFHPIDTALYPDLVNSSRLLSKERWEHLEDSLAREKEWKQRRRKVPNTIINFGMGTHTFPTQQVFVAPILLHAGVKLNKPDGPLIGLDTDWIFGVFSLFPNSSSEQSSSSFLLPSVSVSERVFSTAPFYVGAGTGLTFDIDKGTEPIRPFIVGSAFVESPWMVTRLRGGYVIGNLADSHRNGFFLMFSIGIALGA